jgi:hypothetical protein
VLAECWQGAGSSDKVMRVKMTTKQKKEPPEDIREALLRFTRQEPEAVANLLALLAADFKVELVIHEHKAAEENGYDPGERREWSMGSSRKNWLFNSDSSFVDPGHVTGTGSTPSKRHSSKQG